MTLTLRELLSFEVMQATRPQILAGADGLGRVVRWVHTSEIYEIAPLLSGGELLLTTGLGLAGADAGARRHYVRELALRGVTGLAVELGRSFVDMPPELVDEAERQRLPLVALHEVVPFVRITEVANTAIVDYSGHQLRTGDAVTRALNEALIAGAGVGRLLVVAASSLQCPLVVVSASGALVASHGVADDRAAWTVADDPHAEAHITMHTEQWGRLLAGHGSPLTYDELIVAVDRVATAIALAVLRIETPPNQRDRQAAALLSDLISGDVASEADLAQRATVAGFHLHAADTAVGVVVDGSDVAAGLSVLRTASRILGSASLNARVGQSAFGVLVVATERDGLTAVCRSLTESVKRVGSGQIRVSVGLPVTGGATLRSVGRSLREARTLSVLTAEQLGLTVRAPVIDARSHLPELLLSEHDAAELGELARRLLPGLTTWDDEHSSALVHTLEVHLRCGGSATRSARSLHIGRQALYQRLERIEALLGFSITDAEVYASLLLAACAHRLHRVGDA